MTTQKIVKSIVEQQHISDASNEEMYKSAVFILSLYALEIERETDIVIEDILNMIARIAIEKVREFNLTKPFENE